jgi:hypothetical protein
VWSAHMQTSETARKATIGSTKGSTKYVHSGRALTSTM